MAYIIDSVGSQSSQSVEETEDKVDTGSEDTLNALPTCHNVSACENLHSEIIKLTDIIDKQQDRISNMELQMSKILSLLQNVSDVQKTQLKSSTLADSDVTVAHNSSASIENQSSPNPWHRQARRTGEHGGGSRSARQADKRENRYSTNDTNGDDDDSKETREATDSHFTMIVLGRHVKTKAQHRHHGFTGGGRDRSL